MVYVILNGKTECTAEVKIAKLEAGEVIMGYLVGLVKLQKSLKGVSLFQVCLDQEGDGSERCSGRRSCHKPRNLTTSGS